MAITHQITLGVGSGGNLLSRELSVEGSQEIDIDEVIPYPEAELQIALPLVRSSLKTFFMTSDQALTVKVNSDSAPDQTFTLSANRPVYWYSGHPVAVTTFLAADITNLFVSNDSGEDATFIIKALSDATP